LGADHVASVSQITLKHFDQFQIERSKTLHPRTLFNHCMVIKMFMKWLAQRKLIAENPLAGIPLTKPRRRPKERPSLDQLNQLLWAADPRLRSLLAVLALTGARVGEIRNLRPQDVDLPGNWLWVRSRPGAETKTRTERKVPIHARLRPVLEEAVAAARGPHLFTARPCPAHPDGRPINRGALNRQFQRLAHKLAMPTGRDSGYTLHSFRRFFESHTVNAGIPQRVVDAWLGHTADKSTAAIYYSVRPEESQSFMCKVPFGDGPPATEAGKEGLS
jgi:integrase